MDNADSGDGESPSDSGDTAVRVQLARIMKSGPFQRSRRRQRFLEYIVHETLAGRGDRIKGYTIAVEVFERPETFDSNVDPTVRMEAARLREKLREYYEVEGHSDPIRIDLPKGCYTPKIEFRQVARSGPEPKEFVARTDEQQAKFIPNKATCDGAGDMTGPISHLSTHFKIGWAQSTMLAVAVLLIIAASFSWIKGPYSGPSLVDRPSIAILPFDNIGDDPKWDRFADGVTEDIITDLSHSKDLIVIARTSTEVYRGKQIDIRQIGRDLTVKYVLEGSIQSMDERIRVTAQLIDAASGGHVWSERYDRPVDDLFSVQNSVTQRIAATLAGWEGAVATAERHLVRRKPPASLTAFDTYLLAVEAKHRVTKEGLIEAERLFRKALELDPQLARAHVGLVDVYFYLIDLGLASSVEETRAKQMEAAEKALQLDPKDGKAHLALAIAFLSHGKQQQAAIHIERAETLSPSDADVLVVIAWSIPQYGDSKRAISLAERSLELNPHYPDWYNQGLSYAFFFGGQFDKSVKYRLLVKAPLALDYAYLAAAYAYLGRGAEAEIASANAKRLDPAWIAERYLSDSGGYAEKEAELFVVGARKARLSDCVPSDNLKDMPNLIQVKSCRQRRATTSG